MKLFLKWIAPVFSVILLVLITLIVIWPEKSYQPYQISPEYKTQVENFHVPPMPENWMFERFTATDGTKLRIGMGFETPDAKATLFVIPGFTGILEQYGEHLSYWQANGFNVAGMDLRGQGGSERPLPDFPERPWVEDFSVYSKDLYEILATGFSKPDIPLIIVGSSLGGHIAYRTASEYGAGIDGMVLTAPVFRPNTAPYSFRAARLMMNAARWLGRSQSYAPGQGDWKPDPPDMTRPIPCSAAPERVYIRDAVYARNPDLRMGTATNQWLAELMESGETTANAAFASRIKIPVTMLLADRDRIIINDKSRTVCDLIPECSVTWLEDSGHCIPQERDEIIAAMYQAVEDMALKVSK